MDIVCVAGFLLTICSDASMENQLQPGVNVFIQQQFQGFGQQLQGIGQLLQQLDAKTNNIRITSMNRRLNDPLRPLQKEVCFFSMPFGFMKSKQP
jgi:hypothetical protein